MELLRSTHGRVKGTTSTGVGKRPKRSTSFESSTMTMKRRAAIAIAFSRKSAPPPPLVSDPVGSHLIGPVDCNVDGAAHERNDGDAELATQLLSGA